MQVAATVMITTAAIPVTISPEDKNIVYNYPPVTASTLQVDYGNI
jgi:hypothetical protein